MINNAKRKYRNYCPPPDARYACSTAGGIGAGAAALASIGNAARQTFPVSPLFFS